MFNIDPSKAAGALFGTQVGQLVVASLTHFAHLQIDSSTAAAIIGISVFAVAHFLPSGAQK